MFIWWKKFGIMDDCLAREAGFMDHNLYAWARKSYGGIDGQMRLWVGKP